MTEDMLNELAAFRALREQYLNRLAGIGLTFNTEGNGPGARAVAEFRVGLLDLPALPAVQEAVDLESLQGALKAGYAALVAAVPDDLRYAFAKVDA